MRDSDDALVSALNARYERNQVSPDIDRSHSEHEGAPLPGYGSLGRRRRTSLHRNAEGPRGTISAPSISAQKVIFLIVVWYITSALAVLLLKGLFQGRFSATTFKFPLTITATSNIVSGTLASLVYYFLYAPQSGNSNSNSGTWNNAYTTHKSALFIGVMTSAEIGLKNAALSLLTVSLSTILKGTAPMLVMFWGVLFGIYKPSLKRLGVVLTVAVGLFLAVDGSNADSTTARRALDTGVTLQLLSAVLSGLRWVITQIFVKNDTIGKNTVNVVRLTCPYTALAIFPAVIYWEAHDLTDWIASSPGIDTISVSLTAVGIGTCVFALLWAEYELVRCTSSFTVSLCFVAKETLVIALGVLFFGDQLTAKVVVGFVLVQIGIAMYALQKKQKTHSNVAEYEAQPTQPTDINIPISISDSDEEGLSARE